MKAVGLAELLSQGVDHAHRFREAATAREIEMDEDMYRACKRRARRSDSPASSGQFARSAGTNESSNSPNSYVMAAPDWLSLNYTAGS